MALAETTTAAQESHDQARTAGSRTDVAYVVCLGPAYRDASTEQVAELLPALRAAAGATGKVLVGYPVTADDVRSQEQDGVVLQPFLEASHGRDLIVQTAAAWLNAHELVRAHKADGCVLLGAEAQTLRPEALTAMIDAVCRQGSDLAVPRYDVSSTRSLLNTAVLSPLSRALFNANLHFPLTLDVACSARMSERMAAAAQRYTAANLDDALVWPAAEAAVAGFSFAEITAGYREIPHTTEDLGALLNRVAGSLFADVEAKAAFWQRTRPPAPMLLLDAITPAAAAPREPLPSGEIAPLVESFRNGYHNLHEIWSLVLPPNTLVTLKRLSAAPLESFRLQDAVWVRIIYDFVLAHRLRTIPRNHLMGAFAPLYLAWVASHLLQAEGADPAASLARAFEADKPYLVSRWRWPDRFNP